MDEELNNEELQGGKIYKWGVGEMNLHPAFLDNEGNELPIEVVASRVDINPMRDFKFDPKTVTGKRGCAEAMRLGYGPWAEKMNFFGNAWDLLGSTYTEGGVDPMKAEVGDIVPMYRDRLPSDEKNGVPSRYDAKKGDYVPATAKERNDLKYTTAQHIGYVSGHTSTGVPLVTHYLGNRWVTEPITNVRLNANVRYDAPKAYKTLQSKKIYTEPLKFKYDDGYEANEYENLYLNYLKDNKKDLQKKLFLDNNEFEDLAKICYQVMGAESSFGRSPRYLIRNAMPDGAMKLMKNVRANPYKAFFALSPITLGIFDKINGDNPNNDFINSLSTGMGSVKQSSFYSIGKRDPKNNKKTIKEVNADIRNGDTEEYERNQTWGSRRLGDQGLDFRDADDPKTSFGITFTKLAEIYHRVKRAHPEMSAYELRDAIAKMYNGGGAKFAGYLSNLDKYATAIDGEEGYPEYGIKDKAIEKLNQIIDANKAEKKARSEGLATTLAKSLPLPLNIKAFANDLFGNRKITIDNAWLREGEEDALRDVIERALARGSSNIEYKDYATSENANDDVGAKGGGMLDFLKRMAAPSYSLKTTIGQGRISQDDDYYYVDDTFDYNDAGKSFGLLHDMNVRGWSPYNFLRSIGRNYGSPDGVGAKVHFRIKKRKDEK